MRVLVQWSRLNPSGWETVESEDWARIPAKPRPPPRNLDNSPGWIHRLNVQGVEFSADHYAVEHISSEEVRITIWNDHPPDYPAGKRFAQVWTFKNLAPDPSHGGAINTRQSQIIYLDFGGELHQTWTANGPLQNTEFRDWSEFQEPAPQLVRHGVMVSNARNLEHDRKCETRGWREWTDGIPADQIDSRGRVKQQRPQGKYRKPFGTITYYQRDTNLLGVHTPLDDTDAENELNIAAGGGETEVSTAISGGESTFIFCFTTLANNPNVADWPSGNYDFQLDTSSVGAAVSYGARAAGTAVGHIARVNGALSADLQTWAQTEPIFTASGLRYGSTGTIDPTAGLVTDRYEILIAATRPANHGNQSVTLTYDTDGYATGPWTIELTADAGVADAQAQAVSPTITLGPTKNVSAGVADAQAQAVSPTITNAALTADAGVADAQGQAASPTITNGPELTAAAAVSDAQAQSISPTVVNQALTAAAVIAVAVASSISPTVTKESEKTAAAAVASSVGTANAATVEKEITADAVVAFAVGTALAATVTNGPENTADATIASGVGTANAATITNGPEKTADATIVSAVATANSPTVVNQELTADAAVATAVGTANPPTVVNQELTAPAAVVSAVGTANSPTVVNQELTASAAVTSAVASTNAATVEKEITVDAAVASAPATSLSPTVINGPEKTASADVASAVGIALAATVVKDMVADAVVASAVASALGPTVTNGPELTASADTASAVASAISPAVTRESELNTNAAVASVVAEALAATVTKSGGSELIANASVASATSTANQPTVELGPNSDVDAVVASAVAVALGAEAQIGVVTKVPPNDTTAMGVYLKNGPVSPGDAVFSLQIKAGESALITFPSTVTIRSGKTAVQFEIAWAAPGTTILQAQLTEYNGVPVVDDEIFDADVECLESGIIQTLAPSTFKALVEDTVDLAVVFSGSVFGDQDVAISSDDDAVATPKSAVVTVLDGEFSAVVQIDTLTAGSATITATHGTGVRQSSVTVVSRTFGPAVSEPGPRGTSSLELVPRGIASPELVPRGVGVEKEEV